MEHAELPVHEAWFCELAAGRPGTAAAQVPLVMWHDVIDARMMALAFRHHDFLSLYLVRRGRGMHVIDGVPYSVARGDVYAMGQGQTHHFTDCEDLLLHTLHFSPAIFDAATRDALMQTRGFQSLFVEEPLHRAREHGAGGRWLHLTPDGYESIAASLAELEAEWSSGTPSGTALTRALFVRLLVHLARRYADSARVPNVRATPQAPASHEPTVAAAVRYLDEHFAEPLRIEQIAAQVFLSPDRFTEVFARAMGRTPRDYLRHLRLERAKTLLTGTRKPVSAVALEAGFGDAAYFTRVFRAATGRTPTGYRRP